MQNRFLKEETVFRKGKEQYEEAEHRRRLAAIGLAAALLEEGKPCPVCGSKDHVEHPKKCDVCGKEGHEEVDGQCPNCKHDSLKEGEKCTK